MESRDTSINVIGLGYIGLPTAIMFADAGLNVCGVDTKSDIVDSLNKGQAHIVEPGLSEKLLDVLSAGNFSVDYKPQVATVHIICVPTPLQSLDGSRIPDISYIERALDSLIPIIKKGDMLILESTSPVGTTNKLETLLAEQGIETDSLDFAYCPERVLPGNILNEMVFNDRIIGGVNERATERAAVLYERFVQGSVLRTNARTAELCKLAENSYRDVNIAFANELSMLADVHGANVSDVIRLANHHPRVDILMPGPGVGGHCIAVDPWFLAYQHPMYSALISQARLTNDFKRDFVVEKILTEYDLRGAKNVCCFGLTYKPDVDDLRESPSAYIAETLVARGIQVYCVEPNLKVETDFKLLNLQDALVLRDTVFVVLVKHSAFIDEQVRGALRKRAALDFCGALNG